MVFSPSDLYVSFCRNVFYFVDFMVKRRFLLPSHFVSYIYSFLYFFVKEKKNINGFILYVKIARKNRSTNTKKIFMSIFLWLAFIISLQEKKCNFFYAKSTYLIIVPFTITL